MAPGVYRFRDSAGRTLYIGRAAELRRRVASYWGPLRDRRHLRRMVPHITRIEAVECDSEHEAAWLERNLLERGRPRWNRTTGTESIVYIGLNHRLEVRHDAGGPGLCFGPYLGGDKVRLAVSGLDRVLPLAYAGATLGGFDRDLALMRGIEPGSRAELSATIEAVLHRDATAGATVLAQLTDRRDAAAAALAFELAARIQEELEALDWVLAEQKVTVHRSTVDAAIHGWADGVLVSFQLHQGRLHGWTQRPCTEAAGVARVLATPHEWQAFATRTATLAARLAHCPS
jgi:excinuclease ABC subunit C